MSAVIGQSFIVLVTAGGPGGQIDQRSVVFEVYPADTGIDVTCTKDDLGGGENAA